MIIGHPLMHQTTSLTLQTWQGLCIKHLVAFSSSKNSCMTSNNLDSKCNRKMLHFQQDGQQLEHHVQETGKVLSRITSP